MARSSTVRSTASEAKDRLRVGRAYLDVATLVLDETEREEFSSVAAGLAVLAGIAASDAICSIRLKLRHRGDDHRGAADLLSRATPDGKQLGSTLSRLLDVKDAAHYGVHVMSAKRAGDAVKWAAKLVSRASEEMEA